MRRKVLGAAAIIALLAGPVFAQQQAPMQKYGDKDKEKTPNELQLERDAERAYQRSLGNIPAQKSTDPWGTVRSDDAPKAATKTAAPKPKAKNDTKTDSAAKQ